MRHVEAHDKRDRLHDACKNGELIPAHWFGEDGAIKPEYRAEVARLRREHPPEPNEQRLFELAQHRKGEAL